MPVQETNPLSSLQNSLTSKIDSFDSRDKWLQYAQQRTEEFHRKGLRAPTTWVLVSGHEIPVDAFVAGEESGKPLFAARAHVEVKPSFVVSFMKRRNLTWPSFNSGWIMYGSQSQTADIGALVSDTVSIVDVGKAGRHLSKGAEIGRQHKIYALHEYEILLGDSRAVRWVETHGVPNPHNFGARHIDAGVDAHGHQIFVVQVSHNGGVHPARANSGASGMFEFFDVRIRPLGV